jgi:hypothetical protein
MLRATSKLTDKGKITLFIFVILFIFLNRNQIMACSMYQLNLDKFYIIFVRNFFVNIQRVNWIEIHLLKRIKNFILKMRQFSHASLY